VPGSLLVVGGGYIGLELGTVYSALGSKVTVVEALSGILPTADRDLVEHLERSVSERFDELLTNTRVDSISIVDGKAEVKLLSLDLENPTRTYDRVLVSVGRTPNARDIGLENTAVKVDDKGFIEVDAQRRTAEESIFAIGDVAGEPMLAHKATYEARIAAETIAGRTSAFDPKAIPAVVFTDPEVAWAGLTEMQARTDGVPHKVARFPWAASGRATSVGRNDGLTKMLLDPVTERLIGVGIVGVGAGELIAEATLAIEMGATATDMKMTVHAHPTLSETVMEAAEVFYGHSPHFMERKR
jgi:dihydrolipoamide dehydrogenase